jgi:hypothetical protein
MSENFTPDPSSEESMRRARMIRLALVIFALVVAAWGIGDRLMTRSRLAQSTLEAAIPTVTTLSPTSSPDGESLLLAGNTQAYAEAAIYARTSGYVKSWSKDLGAHVHKGAVLAVIETPEVDQQLRQAQADLENAKAAYEIARSTDERWKGLVATESVSKQDAEQKAADAAMKHAGVRSAEANLARLHELQQFKHVQAPFDGIVTQRSTDVGALVSAGQNAGAPLFRMADVHRFRIYSAVPESYASQIVVGSKADVSFEGRAGSYVATIVSTAEAIDPTTRTLQIEMQMDNKQDLLLAGAYARVHLDLGRQSGLPRIPVTALLFRSDGLWVATTADRHRVHLRKIIPGRDFGTDIEVREGLDPNNLVIANPPDSLIDGAEIRVAPGKGR